MVNFIKRCLGIKNKKRMVVMSNKDVKTVMSKSTKSIFRQNLINELNK